MDEFIVVMPRIEGNPEAGYRTEYYSDMRRWPTWERARVHGTGALDQSDDFLIGRLQGNKLMSLQWMDEVRDDASEVANAATSLGLGS